MSAGPDRLTVIDDAAGTIHARLDWRDDQLERLVVGEPGAWTMVGGARVAHPLFGVAHPIGIAGEVEVPERDAGEPTTWMGAVEWARPTTIPPILAPGRLRAGAGSMILNVLASLARDAGVARLRYAGPYPTAALWRSLEQCFRVVGGATEGEFVAGAMERALRGAMDPIAIDFAPAPFERVRVSPRVTVQRRDGLERVAIDGVAYDRTSRAYRLVAIGDGRWAAELWLGDRAWGRAAELSGDGALVTGPRPLPAVGAELAGMLGARFPSGLLAELAELVAELVAPPLAGIVAAQLVDTSVVWGDAGAAEVVDRGGELVVHAGLWAHLAPHGMAAVAHGLALALAPPLAARAQATLAAAAGAAGANSPPDALAIARAAVER